MFCKRGEALKKSIRTRRKKTIVQAEEFRLVDKRGKCRGRLGMNDDGEPCFLLFDERGKLRISLYLYDGQVGIEVLDRNEKVRASLGVSDNGQPSLELLDGSERTHACLEMGTEDGPGLDLYDKAGNLRASLSLMGKEPIPNLAVIDRNGKRRKVLPKDYKSDAALAFYDESEEGIVMVGPGPYGEPR